MCKYIHPIISSIEHRIDEEAGDQMVLGEWCSLVVFKGKAGRTPSLLPLVSPLWGKESGHPRSCVSAFPLGKSKPWTGEADKRKSRGTSTGRRFILTARRPPG